MRPKKRAQIIRGQAEATSTRIYAEAYNQGPDFYRFLRTLETYENSLGENTRIILGTDSPLFELLKNMGPEITPKTD